MKTIIFKDNILNIDNVSYINYNNIYFISDTHFFHFNICKYCDRPFSSASDMNKTLISNWNSVVTHNDIVIIHGDFAFADKKGWNSILSSLNGYKILLKGNHDRESDIPHDQFLLIEDMIELYIHDEEIEGKWQNIICCHYPILCYKGQHKGYWQTYGHVHSRINNTGNDRHLLNYLSPNQYDVGVDNNNFTPISYEQLKTIITKQNVNKK